MARPKSNNVQINISIPSEWKEQLENLARIYSVEEGTTDRKSTRLNSSHTDSSRMPSSA